MFYQIYFVYCRVIRTLLTYYYKKVNSELNKPKYLQKRSRRCARAQTSKEAFVTQTHKHTTVYLACACAPRHNYTGHLDCQLPCGHSLFRILASAGCPKLGFRCNFIRFYGCGLADKIGLHLNREQNDSLSSRQENRHQIRGKVILSRGYFLK